MIVGAVSGNTSYSFGGGVSVSGGGTFTMSGGAISGNTSSGYDHSFGGGVVVWHDSTFTMDGGTISGNTATATVNSFFHPGGGVYVLGAFILNDGTISGNPGGGVYTQGGTFTMNGGTISDNTSSYYSSYGGGVSVDSGTFTMSGGTISGNSTSNEGGGVSVGYESTFTKLSGGTIYGANAGGTLANTAADGYAVYVSSDKKRNTTAGPGVTLDSSVSGSAGGWEDTVTFIADTETSAIWDVRYVCGGSIGSNMPSEPTKSGYAFGGWYTSAGGCGTQFTASTPVTGDITVYAKWLPGVSLQISLQPVPDDPPLSNISLFVTESASFSAGSGYNSWAWYWNGEAISGADSSTYYLQAGSQAPGIYELSALVTAAGGGKLSARCRVVIRAN
jgi:uncharacterized repeat protein (TIGR02543 family)